MAYSESSGEYSIDRFGARGDGEAKNTAAIQKAVDTCAQAGGGIVIIPSGTWLTGSVALKSNVTPFLHPGATILGACEREDYTDTDFNSVHPSIKLRSLVYAKDAENVSITGYGAIDGNGKVWQDEFLIWHKKHDGRGDALGIKEGRPLRPQLVRMERCKKVRLAGFTAQNSAAWNIHLLQCDDVLAEGLSIVNPENSLNTDGLNPQSCRNVRITNCHISVGDDCICMKAGLPERPYGVCENIYD
ncbi:MAG: hypothetical protein GF401_10320 [Chitinivibrionales bacterium]|nr:hypothetical protein [Chitinivibrionales bacterium]